MIIGTQDPASDEAYRGKCQGVVQSVPEASFFSLFQEYQGKDGPAQRDGCMGSVPGLRTRPREQGVFFRDSGVSRGVDQDAYANHGEKIVFIAADQLVYDAGVQIRPSDQPENSPPPRLKVYRSIFTPAVDQGQCDEAGDSNSPEEVCPYLILKCIIIPDEDHARIECQRPYTDSHTHGFFVVTTFGVYHEHAQHQQANRTDEDMLLQLPEIVSLLYSVVQRKGN